jgi:hypothetical protein
MDAEDVESLRIKCPGNCDYASKYGFNKALIKADASYAYCCWRCWQLHDRVLTNAGPSQGRTHHGPQCGHIKYIPGMHGVHETILDAYLETEEPADLVDVETSSAIDAQSVNRKRKATPPWRQTEYHLSKSSGSAPVTDPPPRGWMEDIAAGYVDVNAHIDHVPGLTPESEPEAEPSDAPKTGDKYVP